MPGSLRGFLAGFLSSVAATGAALVLVLPVDAAPAPEDEPADGSYWADHFSLHGYATLGFTDGNLTDEETRTADEVMMGFEEGGSFPYGNAAINLRYEPAARHSFVLQLAYQEQGASPSDDFEVDWLFYQAQLTGTTRLRLGRQPVPSGIFNELRDVGVLLPFFRPAYVIYREGSIFSETVDGIGVTQKIFPQSPWNLELSGYYGEFDVLRQGLGFFNTPTDEHADDAWGGQLWLSTPVEGLRFGFNTLHFRFPPSSTTLLGDRSNWDTWGISIDGSFEKLVVRGEYLHFTSDAFQGEDFLAGAEVDDYYLQLGWRTAFGLGFYVQQEVADSEVLGPIYVGGSEKFREREDLGFSVVYEVNPNLVLRGEYHEVEAEIAEDFLFVPDPVTGALLFQSLYDTFESDYFILSISASF